MTDTQKIDQERIRELREALSKIPGAAGKKMTLEVYTEGGELLQAVNIKTGRPLRTRNRGKNER